MERRRECRAGACSGGSAQPCGVFQHLAAALAYTLFQTSHIMKSSDPAIGQILCLWAAEGARLVACCASGRRSGRGGVPSHCRLHAKGRHRPC
jgi:hypothetical protein